MLLQFDSVEKHFGEKHVLKGISFSANSGKAFGLLGRNGAGKTTSIRILMNVFSADRGKLLIDAAPIDYNKIKIGYLPEERGLYPKMKIIDQLVYFAELKDLSHNEAVKTVNYWLEKLEMEEYRSKRLDTLSKGNQQKIQLITALAHDPQIVILDEPFSGLDPVNAMILKDIVKEEISRGKIVLFSSHQMNYIEELCDSVAILHDGQIALLGNVHEIKRNYPRNRLLVQSEQREAIKAAFQDHNIEEKLEHLIITLQSPKEKHEVMKRLASEFDVDAIKVFEPSLNDIFVEFAGVQS